tara:strand:+ start:3179 stop:4594 length:1416 start_codon:yes stop_codon:yes gene_type:complete
MLSYFTDRLASGVPEVKAHAVGHISRVVGLSLEAVGLNLALGARCQVIANDSLSFEVEVVGFNHSITYLMPLVPIRELKPGALVKPIMTSAAVLAGEALLGRVIDGVGSPIDGKGPLGRTENISFHPQPINPLEREPIHQVLDVGVRSINASLSIGCGQRIGLFAGSGVGKSVLLGMMSRFTEADVVIVALVGERGKEVREFVESNLSGASLAKTVIVAAPADQTPVMRLRSGMYATRLAEYFRDQGKRTLLLFDSLTRYAQAQREIALATGEPPATKGYPPSVFARLPQLVERAGNGSSNVGSVTAIYTVLVEGDDMNDPIADSARAILDGHIVLSREIAEQAIYPAVDIQASVSRSMVAIVNQTHLRSALKVKQLYTRYQQSKDLINVGAYVAGADEITDLAVSCQPAIEAFLTQSHVERVSFDESISALSAILTDASDGHVDESPQIDVSFVSEPSSSSTDPVISNNV